MNNELYDILKLVNDSEHSATWNVVSANYNGSAWHLTINETARQKIRLIDIMATFVRLDDEGIRWSITRAEYEESQTTWNTWYVTLKREAAA